MRISTLVLAVATSATLAVSASAQDSGIRIGERPANARVRTLDGKPVDLSRYVGKTPVLLQFWATWCSNCRELEPAMLAAQKKHGRRVRFVGVAVSVNQSPGRVLQYAKKHGLKHDILFDTDGEATDAYRVPATSYIVILDRTGRVSYTGVGGNQNIEAALKKVL